MTTFVLMVIQSGPFNHARVYEWGDVEKIVCKPYDIGRNVYYIHYRTTTDRALFRNLKFPHECEELYDDTFYKHVFNGSI